MTASDHAFDDGAGTLAAAAAGDADAFERLVAQHHEDLRRVCALVIGDDRVADEAVQAAWSIAWRRLGSVRDGSRLRSWLASIAINEARRATRGDRRRAIRETRVAADDVAVRDRDPQALVAHIDLRNALRRLAPEERALLGLRYVSGFDATELGAALGMSASGVRSRLARLLDRLERELDDG